jgi:hypothetical protein
MKRDVAIVRQHVSRIPGVSRTWLEWSLEEDVGWVKTLVVEVEFDTDPNSTEFRQNVFDAIASTAIGAQEETTMIISSLRVVPKRKH